MEPLEETFSARSTTPTGLLLCHRACTAYLSSIGFALIPLSSHGYGHLENRKICC